MTPLESRVWAATFADVYVAEMELGRRRGESPLPLACAKYATSAVDVADSAVFALRVDGVLATSGLLP